MKEQLNSNDLILLSAYLDGEVNPREKARVEALLQSDQQAKEIYESLLKTKTVLRNAPLRKVPRNFTLSAAVVQPRRPLILIPALRFSSVLATLVAVWMFIGQLLPGWSARPFLASEPVTEMQAVSEAETERTFALPSDSQQTPPVVYWGGPPQPPATGMGGAGIAPGCPDAFCGGAPDVPYAEGRGGGSEEPTFKAQGMPAAGEGAIQLNPVPTQIEPLPLEGSGPILGVRPAEEAGKALPTPTTSQPVPAGQVEEPLLVESGGESTRPDAGLLAGAGLLLLAAGLWLVSVLLKRKIS
ncbi:MAG: hypothetical protein AB1522_02785 [Chloroflexota bacterium]